MRQRLRSLSVVSFLLLSFLQPIYASAQTVSPSPIPASRATLRGIIASAGAPLASVTVSVNGPVSEHTLTGSDGAYVFDDLSPGVYSLSATRSGFETASSAGIAVLAGTVTTINASLTASSLSSLRTIGTVRTSARGGFNTSGLSVTTLDASTIELRQEPNLANQVGELPGVTLDRDSQNRTPNVFFAIRGLEFETKVNVDGHELTSGSIGKFNAPYSHPDVFQQVEVLKGAGLNGPNAGESAVGTINLRTRDFSARNEANLRIGVDSFGSGYYSALVNLNLLPKNKLSLLGVRSYQGINGPNNNYMPFDANVASTGGGVPVNYGGPALARWTGDFSDRFATGATLIKGRYRFSDVTGITASYLGSQGSFRPQGGSYGYYYGSYPLAQCYNPSSKTYVVAGGTGCSDTSVYNVPAAMSAVGTNVNLYDWFPNAEIENTEIYFAAELRTQIARDTILVRPYTSYLNRFINGAFENTQPGYGSGSPNAGWYQVTTPANCGPVFAYNATSGTGGSRGPCFSAANNYSSAYIGPPLPQFPVAYATTPVAPECSSAAPCWTTPTNFQRNGVAGFSTPFSQPEVDHARGITFSYLHPVADNLYGLSFDYNVDDSLKYTGDTSDQQLPQGCFATAQAVPVTSPNWNPACNVAGRAIPIPQSSLQVPPTQNHKYDVGLTGVLQLTPRVQLGLGGYYTLEKLYYENIDPSKTRPDGSEVVATSLSRKLVGHAHFDPHAQLEFRATPDLSLRASAGSGITVPYATQVSGLPSVNLNGGPGGTVDTIIQKNPALLPESTVAYDFGLDYRLPTGAVISSDIFDDTIYNVWVNSIVPAAPGFTLPGRTNQVLISEPLNGALLRSYGLEWSVKAAPQIGFGYTGTFTLQRAYYDKFGIGFYQAVTNAANNSFSGIVNGKQVDGSNSQGQIPYFKAKAELNWTTQNRAHVAFGDAFYGGNNSTGGPGYSVAYANWSQPVGAGVGLLLSVNNLFNFNSGTFIGQSYAYQGFVPVGIGYNPKTGTLAYGPANYNGALGGALPTGIQSIPPRNAQLTLTKHF